MTVHTRLRPITATPHSPCVEKTVANGVVLVGSDAHIWPGEHTTAQRAFVRFCDRFANAKTLKGVVMNGDVLDFPQISRHPPIGWESAPDMREELDAAAEFLDDVTLASGKAWRVWTLGNHDARFETRLASVAAQYKGVKGIHLKDHFPDWAPCWSIAINETRGPIIKHRFKGGMHATQNNALWAGRSVVTGHLHSLRVTPLTDYNGTRYGVDCGTLSEPRSAKFGYNEDNPSNWRSGFAVLTFWKGMLLYPELVSVLDEGRVQWRGEVVRV